MKHITNSVNKLDRLENYNFLPFLIALALVVALLSVAGCSPPHHT